MIETIKMKRVDCFQLLTHKMTKLLGTSETKIKRITMKKMFQY